jgi:hypothetical protein
LFIRNHSELPVIVRTVVLLVTPETRHAMEIHQNARATIPPGQIWEEKYEYQKEPENERPAPVRADILSVGVTDAAGQRLAPRLDRSKVEVADAHGLRSIELVTRSGD